MTFHLSAKLFNQPYFFLALPRSVCLYYLDKFKRQVWLLIFYAKSLFSDLFSRKENGFVEDSRCKSMDETASQKSTIRKKRSLEEMVLRKILLKAQYLCWYENVLTFCLIFLYNLTNNDYIFSLFPFCIHSLLIRAHLRSDPVFLWIVTVLCEAVIFITKLITTTPLKAYDLEQRKRDKSALNRVAAFSQ